MPISRSQGEERPQNWRVDELPSPVPTGDTAAERDATTGRFLPRNQAARRRTLKRVAHQLAGLDPAACAPWLRPFVTLAGDHAAALLGELPIQTAATRALAVDTATACAVYRGLLALGAAGDREALAESRAWLREHRQSVIALTGLARQEAGAHEAQPLDLEAHARRVLDAREAAK